MLCNNKMCVERYTTIYITYIHCNINYMFSLNFSSGLGKQNPFFAPLFWSVVLFNLWKKDMGCTLCSSDNIGELPQAGHNPKVGWATPNKCAQTKISWEINCSSLIIYLTIWFKHVWPSAYLASLISILLLYITFVRRYIGEMK